MEINQPINMLKIASCQFAASENISQNIEIATQLVSKAYKQGVDLVLLPEIFCAPPYQFDLLKTVAEKHKNGPIQDHFSSLAKKLQIWIAAGSIPLKSPDGSLTNSALVYDPQGKEVLRYDKIHLFTYEGLCEGHIYKPGNGWGTFNLFKGAEIYRLALAICFEIRFTGLFFRMNRPDLILIPAAFTVPTGRAHWKTLLKSRAIENQCYICACDQAEPFWGHSMIIDPWGEVLEELDTTSTRFITSEINKARIFEVRSKIPMFESDYD